jgi:hypothetical protein
MAEEEKVKSESEEFDANDQAELQQIVLMQYGGLAKILAERSMEPMTEREQLIFGAAAGVGVMTAMIFAKKQLELHYGRPPLDWRARLRAVFVEAEAKVKAEREAKVAERG